MTNVITSVVGVTSLSLALTMGEAWSAHIAYTSLVSNTVGVLAYAGGWRNDVVESGGGAAPSGVSLVVSDRERLTYIVGGSLRYAWRSATLQIPEFNALRPCTDTAVDQNAFYTARVSLSSDGVQGNQNSFGPSLSADGRYVAFYSSAANLVPGDTNGKQDVFVRDLLANQTTRVSVATGGGQADGDSYAPAISADGRFVAFLSRATNLVPGDANGKVDVFVYDRQTAQTQRVSVNPGGSDADGDAYDRPALSQDGRIVAFASFATNLAPGDSLGEAQIYARDRQTGVTTRLSVAPNGAAGDHSSGAPSLSADGRFVAFYSYATDLVAGDSNQHSDIFVRDRQTNHTIRVSLGLNGTQPNQDLLRAALSANGRYVAYEFWRHQLGAGRHEWCLRRFCLGPR